MLEKKDFAGLFKSKPMIPDCIHNDELEFFFYNRNGEFNINVQQKGKDPIMLFICKNFEITSMENNDKFQISIEDLGDEHTYKHLNGRLYIKVPEPRAFKIYLNGYGWRYFEEII